MFDINNRSIEENDPFLHRFSQTPEELEDVSDLEEDHDARSRTSIQTEGKTDRVCIIPAYLKSNLTRGKMPLYYTSYKAT